METELKKELEGLLARQFGGEGLDADQQDRLNRILEESEEGRDLYMAHCQMEGTLTEEEGLLAILAGDAVPENVVTMEEDPGSTEEEVLGRRNFGRRLATLAACLLFGLVAWGAYEMVRTDGSGDGGAEAMVKVEETPDALAVGDDSAGLPMIEEEKRSPEEEYRMKMLAVVGTGSMDRPPTGFETVALSGPVDFNRDIRPILSDKCLHCHGPDAEDRKADLRVDTEEGIFMDLGGYAAVVPGKPEESELMVRVLHDDEDELMPPPDSNKVMTAREKDLLGRWITEGAEWQDHWSLEPVSRPELPGAGEEYSEKGVRNEIDEFVLAQLKAAGMKPSAEASRETLVRRLTLDLTGLPPTPEEVKAFVKDEGEEGYEQLVDRLLDSPRYGEHRARYWLDAARYADTHGFHFDNYRSVWPYRDWVVKAFNTNMPFDQFTVEQLAGDLLPNATLEQRIATGFNRCNPTTNEGGVINEEYLSIYAKDRVETTGTVFMGLTMNCTSCHDHKFDPLTQKEFYQMEAFFRNTTQPARDGNKPDSPPNMVVPPVEDRARWAAIPMERKKIEKGMQTRRETAWAAFQSWAEEATPEGNLRGVNDEGLVLRLAEGDEGGTEARNGVFPEEDQSIELGNNVSWVRDGGRVEPVIRIGEKGGLKVGLGRDQDQLSKRSTFDKESSFSYGAWVKVPKGMDGGVAVMSRMFEKNSYKGWDLWLERGNRFGVHIVAAWPENAIKVVTKDAVIKPGKWMHLFVTYDGSSDASGVKLYFNGKAQATKATVNALSESIRVDTPLWLGQRSDRSIFAGGLVSDARLYSRRLSPVEVATLSNAAHFEKILAIDPGKRTKGQVDELFGYYLENVDKKTMSLQKQIAMLEAEKRKIQDKSVITLVMEEKQDMEPVAYVLKRGEYDQPGEEVRPAVPEVLPPMANDLPRNRLGLARWLTSREHPLTARVVVNRFWQELFGTGIVKSTENFGVMGEPPSHPELLDWLAAEFVESGWDVKHLFRLMVMSGTYRQSSAADAGQREFDPENRLLARGPRFRLDAEMLRDQALFVSGLMVDTMGGPGVKPYQPGGLWKVVAYPKSDTANFKQDEGEKLYRRTLYTFWKRTSPPPSMSILDAPERESCIVRRERTNTPLQALVLMNDPQFVEAARHLAGRVIGGGDADRIDRISRMGWLTLQRPWEEGELEVLMESLGVFEEAYLGNDEDARGLLEVGDSPVPEDIDLGELAAWTMLANQVMNLDEVVTKN
jgi:hypothetical protein